MLKIMSPVHQNVTLFGKRVIDDVISEDEVMLEWDGPLIQYDCCVYEKRRQKEATEKKRPRGDGGREWSDAAASPGTLGSRPPPEAEKARAHSPLEPSERAPLRRHLDFALLASRATRE